MTFQIFVGGQRVNSADVLNTPAWSHQVRLSPPVTSHAHACSRKNAAAAFVVYDDYDPTRVVFFFLKNLRDKWRLRQRPTLLDPVVRADLS
jgi:hypothetical protein